jgi:hypothetical protein
MSSGLQLVGDWKKAAAVVKGLEAKFQMAAKRALLQEGHFLRGEVVKGIREGAPGGKALAPLAPSTLAVRRGGGFKGSKPLIEGADLVRAITVRVDLDGWRVFVGILRTARGRDGHPLVNVAEIHEFGKAPIAVPITKKSSRYYHALARKGGLPLPRHSGAKLTVIIIKIPPRPFFGPVLEQHGKPDEVQGRFEERMKAIFAG